MIESEVKNLLKQLAAGEKNVDEVMLKLKMEPFENLGFAKPDFHRGIRQGTPEVIYGAGKTKEQIAAITKALLDKGQERVLITRMAADAAKFLSEHEKFRMTENAEFAFFYNELSGIGMVGEFPKPDVYTAKYLGNEVTELLDVGVAGLHRLLGNLETIFDAKVIIAIAGMEGAIASVVGGLADCPVIAVPTSVGYGASFGGLSALLSMLNSCASGVSVVNIDNGFGAGVLASKINKQAIKK